MIKTSITVIKKHESCIQCIQDMMITMYFFTSLCRTCEHELKDFDPFLNMKQLIETLSLVMSLYQELDSGNDSPTLDGTDLEEYTSFASQDEESEEEEDSDNEEDEEGTETKIVEDSKASEKSASGVEEFTSSLDEEENKSVNHDGNSTERESAKLDNPQEKEKVLPSERKNNESNDGDIVTYSNFQEESAALYLLVNLGNEEAIMNVLRLPQKIR